MKFKFNSVGNILLNKTVEIPLMTSVVTTIFQENNEYYP